MRTLVVDPAILLMDEPFGALDTHTKINLHACIDPFFISRPSAIAAQFVFLASDQVRLSALGVIGIVMALGIKQLERRLLRWRPEYGEGA